MNFLTDEPDRWTAMCATTRDDVAKYLAQDFVPDPTKRYRWYFSGNITDHPICIEYDVLSETRCFETVGYKNGIVSDKNLPKKVCKTSIKKFAHRSPVAALHSLMCRQRKIAGYRLTEANRAKARGDIAHEALAKYGHLVEFGGCRTDIPEYEKEGQS